MSARQVFVYGAGGHGKVVADILICRGTVELAGFIDDREDLQGTDVLGLPVVGNSEWLRLARRRLPVAVALGVGDNVARHSLANFCKGWNIEILTPIHPAATVARSAFVGVGTVVMPGAIINASANVGDGAIVNSSSVVEHDVEVGEFAHVAPNATMGGASRLGAFSLLGMGAVLLQRIRIGDHTVVGAGAVVAQNLPDNVVAVGVPARARSYAAPKEHSVRTLALTE